MNQLGNMQTPVKILQQYTTSADTIIVAVSGGPDSMYLLLQCLKVTKNIVVAHVDHGLRRESKEDAEFVQKIAAKYNLPFELKVLKPKEKHSNLEDFFRKQRYTFFERLRKKYQARWVLTGHHLNDNLETVLFNFTKGSFLDGLSGIEVCDPERHLLRPLIFTPQQAILTYLEKHNVPYCTDKTNDDTNYSRNRLRHNVIPQLKKINPHLEKTFANNNLQFQELRDFLSQFTHDWLAKNYDPKKRTLPLKSFQALPITLQKNVLFTLYQQLYGTGKKLSSTHLAQILKIIKQGHANRQKEFGGQFVLVITKKTQPTNQKIIHFIKKDKN